MTMGVLFSAVVLILLYFGWRSRQKEAKEMHRDNLREESGDWIERRSGDRGTYGSFDREQEQERKDIRRQSQINELALLIRTWFFNHYPGYNMLETPVINRHLLYCKSEAYTFLEAVATLLQGRAPDIPDIPPGNSGLQQKMMDFAFEQYPALLDLEIADIRQLHTLAAAIAGRLEKQIQAE